jgi:galactokinase
MSCFSLDQLLDEDLLKDLLEAGGLERGAAAAKVALLRDAARGLVDAGLEGARPVRAFFVPGRIELLGKHTESAGGSSLVAAVEQGFCLVAAPRADNKIQVTDVVSGERARFVYDPELVPAHGHWSNYPMTVARRLARNFPGPRRGVDLAFGSDLPAAAGMSSSSALIVATFLALSAANDLKSHARYARNIADIFLLAEYLGTNENGQNFGELEGDRGVGTFGGSEDHTAILCSEAGKIGQFAYCPTRFERRIAVPAGYTFVLGSSGVVAEKTGVAQELYNRASGRAAAVVQAWRAATGGGEAHLKAILDRGPDAAVQLRQVLEQVREGAFTAAELLQRLQHFSAENQEIIGAAADALEGGDLERFGCLVDRSQDLGATLLGNQVPETVALAAAARACGAAAASAFGAGFGGSVWALVRAEQAADFRKEWSDRYAGAFPQRLEAARFFHSQAGPAAFELGETTV